MARGGPTFIDRVFSPAESVDASLERLAGLFAAKEAAIKALGLPPGAWHALVVSHEPNGAPTLTIDHPQLADGQVSLSISHDGDYAFAVVIAL